MNDTQQEESPPQTLPFTCKRCGKSFAKPQALTMHTVRMHTHRTKIQRAAYAAKRAYRTQQEIDRARAQSRKHNAAYRARNIAQGLTATGKTPKRLPARGTPEYRARLSQAMKASWAKRVKRKTNYVWPLPDTDNLQNTDALPRIKFCPHCGNNLEKHLQ